MHTLSHLRTTCYAAVLLVLTILSGCATVDQRLNLAYTGVDRQLARQTAEISLSQTPSARPLKNDKGEWIIGSLNNVHAVHQAHLTSAVSMDDWIRESLLTELRALGYTVSYPPPATGTPAWGLNISDIESFMQVNQATVSVETVYELKFNITLFKQGAKIKTFGVASRDNQKLPLSASKEAKERIMLRSLQDSIKQILPEIIALTGSK